MAVSLGGTDISEAEFEEALGLCSRYCEQRILDEGNEHLRVQLGEIWTDIGSALNRWFTLVRVFYVH